MSKRTHKTNGETGSVEAPTGANNELGLQEEIISSSGSNPLLEETNLGLGKYDDDYKWQQVRSYRKGLYAHIAFGSALEKRRIYQTKYDLGSEGYNAVYDDDSLEVRTFPELTDEDIEEETSTWNAALKQGRKRWKRLGSPEESLSGEQKAALADKSGSLGGWKPLFWELVAGRHEVSRSDGAELIRDALTGIKELRTNEDNSDGGMLRS